MNIYHENYTYNPTTAQLFRNCTEFGVVHAEHSATAQYRFIPRRKGAVPVTGNSVNEILQVFAPLGEIAYTSRTF